MNGDPYRPSVIRLSDPAVPTGLSGTRLTAIPAFVGYTEFARTGGPDGGDLTLKPCRVRSLDEYEQRFGRGCRPRFELTEASVPGFGFNQDFNAATDDGSITHYRLRQRHESRYLLYDSIRLFYANGGGDCYIVSVGSYSTADGVNAAMLLAGLAALGNVSDPGMLLIPDTVALPRHDDFVAVTNKQLQHCRRHQGRLAIVDVYGLDALHNDSPALGRQLQAALSTFHGHLDPDSLSFGAAYCPYLNSVMIQADQITYRNIAESSTDLLISLLNNEASRLYHGSQLQRVRQQVAQIPSAGAGSERALEYNLTHALPLLQKIESIITTKANVLPAGAALAGVYSANDRLHGVWNPPANVSLQGVVSPTLNIDQQLRAELLASSTGDTVNLVYELDSHGAGVSDAITLAGSRDGGLPIHGRRTLILIQQTIRKILATRPDAAETRVNTLTLLSNFLADLWSRGGLHGARVEQAFSLDTDDDGQRIRVTVALSATSRAEELEFRLQSPDDN